MHLRVSCRSYSRANYVRAIHANNKTISMCVLCNYVYTVADIADAAQCPNSFIYRVEKELVNARMEIDRLHADPKRER